jgi:NhaP-type Na+/H+ and K+/H+ antiporter
MVGLVGIIALLVVLGLSLVITRIATNALSHTGLSREAARFQARSAFTGTGFTTRESEKIVNHPVRRRIVMILMIARSAGLISIIISLILSFATAGNGEATKLFRLLWLIIGVLILWFLANSNWIDRYLNRLIDWALNKWTDLETWDYISLLNLRDGYTVKELKMRGNDWLVGKHLKECRLTDEGVTVLGIYRNNGDYVGAPKDDTKIESDDVLVLYGRSKTLYNLMHRRKGLEGEQEHQQAVKEQQKVEKEQKEKEKEREKDKEV